LILINAHYLCIKQKHPLTR